MSKSYTILCPKLTEALSLREALSWIKGHQLCNVNVEMDALAVVDAKVSEPSRSLSWTRVCFLV
ncbi:conserved hypothetical protein [Ricinus communis]|uniref:RNase H type-1 domain-containing protein n=1 Tax=Ricinus communis TaxID=3988 RepID=B9RUG3_RICCO|nr:conserved hypothetical protein [Ricinus communis]